MFLLCIVLGIDIASCIYSALYKLNLRRKQTTTVNSQLIQFRWMLLFVLVFALFLFTAAAVVFCVHFKQNKYNRRQILNICHFVVVVVVFHCWHAYYLSTMLLIMIFVSISTVNFVILSAANSNIAQIDASFIRFEKGVI